MDDSEDYDLSQIEYLLLIRGDDRDISFALKNSATALNPVYHENVKRYSDQIVEVSELTPKVRGLRDKVRILDADEYIRYKGQPTRPGDVAADLYRRGLSFNDPMIDLGSVDTPDLEFLTSLEGITPEEYVKKTVIEYMDKFSDIPEAMRRQVVEDTIRCFGIDP